MAGWTLGIWIVTALGGAYMWSFTTGAYREESTARASQLPPFVLFVHPLLALTGLSVWIGYLYSGAEALPWVAFGVLVVTALLGDLLVMRTLRPEKPVAVPAIVDPALSPEENERANHTRVEDLIPRPAIIAHGLLAGLTLVMVFLVALGV